MTVMEYIRGVGVIRLVQLSTRLSETLVRLILAQLGLAFYHSHYKGFVHRDVEVRFDLLACLPACLPACLLARSLVVQAGDFHKYFVIEEKSMLVGRGECFPGSVWCFVLRPVRKSFFLTFRLANLMISVDCRVKPIDFATAKVYVGKYSERPLTTFFEKTRSEFNDATGESPVGFADSGDVEKSSLRKSCRYCYCVQGSKKLIKT